MLEHFSPYLIEEEHKPGIEKKIYAKPDLMDLLLSSSWRSPGEDSDRNNSDIIELGFPFPGRQARRIAMASRLAGEDAL